jgi:hypothetical protein
MQRQAEEEARFNEMSEPRGKEVGGTYIAPNALQYLAQALRGIDSKKMGKAAMEGSLGNIGAKQGGLKSIMEMAEKQQQSLAALKAAQILRGNPGAEQEVAQRLREGMDPSLFGPGGAYEGY